ncbi:DUF5689 domain-containing protein [Aquimarina sp. I32.4]|uniref:DUF5689 domain-containing protein n=1 Tax=Aquimarina sp. I32.4 TaxID=2053903 RepID=UPI0011AF8899|nr:DUF5689 domain-containing protein [Aquimarina sp. I32.4]
MYAKRLSYFFIGIMFLNCSEEEFKTPSITIDTPKIEGTIISIDAVLGILRQEIASNGENAKVFFEETDNFIEGYIVSSDKAGNFYKKLIVQDKSNNPSAGIQVLIDINPLYTTYELGRKIYIKLEGVSLGIENGVPTLGIAEGNSISTIPSFYVEDIVIRSTEVVTITPLDIAIEDFTDKLLNLYVKINALQFTKNLVLENNAFTFAAEDNDKYSGERIIESCSSNNTTIVSTSTFSSFKGLKLPNNQGSFEGVLTKNFLGNAYNLVLNDPTGLVFDTESRCDPEVLECLSVSDASLTVFEEDFTNLKNKDLEDSGWINKNTTGGKLTYKIGNFGDNQYIQITGYRSKESLYEAWLITPEIDLNTVIDAGLNFDLQAGYDNGNILEVFVTNNYTEDPSATTWIKLDATISRGPLNAFSPIVSAGPISLSCLEGKIRIGYRYIGGDPRATTRYHIDNIRVTGK